MKADGMLETNHYTWLIVDGESGELQKLLDDLKPYPPRAIVQARSKQYFSQMFLWHF